MAVTSGLETPSPATQDNGGLGASPVHRALGRFMHRKAAVAALAYLLILVLIAILAGVLAPYSPNAVNLSETLRGPSAAHWLGTDATGHDLLSRLMFGTRTSLLAALVATALGLTVGFIVGLISGYAGGTVDYVLMRVCDAFISLPPLLMAIAIVGVLGASVVHAMLGIGVVFAPVFARLVRSQTLEVKEEPYVMAARGLGLRTDQILGRHVAPNILPPLIVQAFITFGYAILAEGSLSFLGLSVQPPTASWGNMVYDAYNSIYQAGWELLVPGVTITAAIWSFNVLGEGLRSAFAVR